MFRTAADAVVLSLGYRFDVAHATLGPESALFAPAAAERFRRGRHESEYVDPEHPAEKSAGDAAWAIETATAAIDAIGAALSAG